MRIRTATDEDKAAWIELRFALWPDCPRDRHELEVSQLLASDGVVLLAFDDQDKAFGFAEVSIRRDHVEGTSIAPVPYLEGWYVAPEYRGKGIGRALIKAVEYWARNAGFAELASDAELENLDSIRAHHALGFREVGRSVHFVRTLTS